MANITPSTSLVTKPTSLDIDATKCIICQRVTTDDTQTSDAGRNRVIEAAKIRNDVVSKYLEQLPDKKFVYHGTNACYKNYTHKNKLHNIQYKRDVEDQDKDKNEEPPQAKLRKSERSSLSRDGPSEPTGLWQKSCVICGFAKHRRCSDKYRIGAMGRARMFLSAAIYFQDSVYTRICDLQDPFAVFGADLYYHKHCMEKYLLTYERSSKDNKTGSEQSIHATAWAKVVPDLEIGFGKGEGYELSAIRDQMNVLLDTPIRNRDIQLLLYNHFGDTIMFTAPTNPNQSRMVYSVSSCPAPDMAEKIRCTDEVRDCAKQIRNELKNATFELDDRFCDSFDIDKSWKSITIPDKLLTFFSGVFNFDKKTFKKNSPEEADENHENISEKISRKMKALFQIMFYIVHHGKTKTPLHVSNSALIHDTCKSTTLITSFNHLGLCMSYDELQRYHNDLANYTVLSSSASIPIPSHFDPGVYTTAAVDNFDHEEATLSGRGGTHDTVSVLFQEKLDGGLCKPNISDTDVVHGSRTFTSDLPCQTQLSFYKPTKRGELPDDYKVDENLFSMKEDEKLTVNRKDVAWALSRLDLCEKDTDAVQPKPTKQKMPSWTATNSVLTEEKLKVKNVAFLPVLPYPVTDYSTVYTAMKNFQIILSQLTQNKLPIACDEGVYHIAKEIQLLRAVEFDNLVLVLGSFHMIKVVLSCMGKYLRGSEAEKIWTESHTFGVNVVESVLTGRHYVRSVKGMERLGESLTRLQWCEFFKVHGVDKYRHIFDVLKELKLSVNVKDKENAQKLMKVFEENSNELINDFNEYVANQCEQNENFRYWNYFLTLVSLLRNLIRSDREGNWALHLDTVQSLLPLFAAFDATNYLRWCSVYLEDMRRLPDTSPETFAKFSDGEFVVKRTEGFFKSVAMDMCLEQTINRSQKATSGIIGSTKQKNFVAKWELIYHELLAVSNVYRDITGTKVHVGEMQFSHENNNPTTENEEMNVQEMVDFVHKSENPFHPSTEQKLHNFLTQEEIPSTICEEILKVSQIGDAAYKTLRESRFVNKKEKIFDTIHRTNLKTFHSFYATKKQDFTRKKTTKTQKKVEDASQKIFRIAQSRGHKTDELLTHDIVPSKFLFDEYGNMTKPIKSTLIKELEKELSVEDYTEDIHDYCAVIDVMANIRKLKTSNVSSFGELCDNFVNYVCNITKHATRIDLVFDSYEEHSIKDAERQRRGQSQSIDLSEITRETSLPVNMDSFWPSSSNKIKLQKVLRDTMIDNALNKYTEVQIVVSHVMQPDSTCISMHHSVTQRLSNLEVNSEEADIRMIPHIFNATNTGYHKIVVFSSDTDVIVALLYFWNQLKLAGLHELWVRAGVGDSTRYIPVHTLGDKLGTDLCNVLPAVHSLTGSDYTSKFGTKHGGLQADPVQYLTNFNQITATNQDAIFAEVEHYLVNVLKRKSKCKNLNELRTWLYLYGNNTLAELPPTSHAISNHIARAYYATNMITSAIHPNKLNPCDYGFAVIDDKLTPTTDINTLPEQYAYTCNCKDCNTKRCSCRKRGIPCCEFCRCTHDCKNPIVN